METDVKKEACQFSHLDIISTNHSLPLLSFSVSRLDGSAALQRGDVSKLLLRTALKGCVRGVAAFGRCLPFSNISLERIELFLELVAEHVDVKGRAVVHTPDEDDGEEDTTRPAVPEPKGCWQHGEDSIRVLDEHEGWLLEEIWQREDDFTDPSFGIRLAEPCEACRAPSSNLVAAAHRDEEVVRDLPNSIWNGRPQHHLQQAVVMGGRRIGVADVVDGGVVLLLVIRWEQVHDAVECDAGHDVDE